MEYNKTLRWLEPYGGWSENDTGLCNRIFHWEIAYELSKQNNFDFKILLQSLHWPELELLYLPYTATFRFFEYEFGLYHDKRFQDLRFKTVFDLENDSVRLASKIDKIMLEHMFMIDNFDLADDKHWYSDFGYDELKKYDKKGKKTRPLTQIKLRHHFIEDFLRRNTQDVIGIHIRRNSGVSVKESDIATLPKKLQSKFRELHSKKNAIHKGYKFFSDKLYFKLIDSILDEDPDQKFYISCDLPYELISYYKERYPNNISTKEDFIPVVQDFLINSGVDIKNLERGQVISNIVDLFSLSFCKFLIRSQRSTWSEFAMYYRNQPWAFATEKVEDIIKKLYKVNWNQPGDYDFDEDLTHETKSKNFVKDVQRVAPTEVFRKLI